MDIYYRVLLKKSDGLLVALVVNARTGTILNTRSTVAREVMVAARIHARPNIPIGPLVSSANARPFSSARASARGNGK